MVFRKTFLLILLIVLVVPGSALAAAPAADPEWELIAPGIEFRKFQLPDPNNVFVVRMDRNNTDVTLESSIAQGKLSEGREPVSGMYSRYDQALNFWGGTANPPTWGMRNLVVVAINGSYFDWIKGIPQGGQVYSGWYAKRFDKMGGWSGFAWKLDRSAFIGECVTHRPEKQLIIYPATGNSQRIGGVNEARGSNELVLFTPQYNSRTGTDNSGVEVLVEMTRPTMILPEPAFAAGIVRQIRNGEGNSLIRFNNIVLSASGTAAEILTENVQIGSEVRVSQEITSYLSNCSPPYPLSWTKTFASIQGAFFFLKDRQIREFNDDPGATNRHPRTAIAFNEQYIFFIVVDGRDSQLSLGMSINELAVFSRDTLGATWGVAQDGGGSSTMVINGQVINNTYCNIYSCMGKYKTYLPLINRSSQQGQTVAPAESEIIQSAAGIERAVGNGMLMVIAQPGEYSTAYEPGDPVTAINTAEIRLGPGTNYASFSSIPMGTHGIILEQMNGLNGVLAKSTYWWYVDFGGVIGWVNEGALASNAIGYKQINTQTVDQ
ncbi:MAG: hypothetical protein A2Y88_06750 [Chloroflexi bacterium RBG_13_48_10]|nr:MAG: hypothetical protein A2Y88_06750 [Chloroflexi bacterium RBG_13_48_10]